MAASDDAGSQQGDNLTNLTADLTFSGTVAGAAVGDYVQLYDGGTAIAGATSVSFASAGTNSWMVDVDLAAGTHTIAARVFDLAGNQSTGALSSALSVTIDTTAPTNSPGAFSFDGQGTDKGSLKEKQSSALIGTTDSVAVVANEYVGVYEGVTLIGTDVFDAADADGAVAWNIDFPSRTLSKGSHTLTAKYFDAAGNVSATTVDYPVTIKSSGSGGRAGGGGSSGAPSFGNIRWNSRWCK